MAITDRASLEAWLEGQPREVVEPIAVRAALRALPGIATEGEATLKRIALPVIRAILTATVRSIYPSADLEDATRDAAKRVSDVASNGTDYSSSPATSIAESAALLILRHSEPNSLVGAVTAALAMFARLSNRKSTRLNQIAIRFFAEITADADQISSAGTQDFYSLSIWLNSDVNDVLQPAWNELRGYFEDDRDVWDFWIRWYNGYLAGSPVSFDLQREVALIPDGIWEEGAEAVAEAIAEIETDYFARSISISETIEFNPESAKFQVQPNEISKPDLIQSTLSQLENAVEDVLVNQSNGLHERSREIRVLQRTVVRFSNDPQRIEMDCTSVHAGLTRQIVQGELPPSEDNLGLQRALAESAQAIRATHPDIAENRKILDSQKIKELNHAQRTVLEDAQPVLEAISENQMRDDFSEDIPQILAEQPPLLAPPPDLGIPERNPVLAMYDEKRRTFGRVAQIAIAIRKTPEIVDKLEATTGYKAAGIITTLGTLVTLGISLF